jgi:hypothetical protein
MADENLSGSEKEHSSGDCPNPNPAKKTNGNPQQQNPPHNSDAGGKFGVAAYVGEIVLAGLCGTGVWIFGEHLVSHGYSKSGVIVNFFAFVIYFAAAPITAIRFWPQPRWVWGLFTVFCVIMAIVFEATSSPEAEPKPHFLISLQTGDSAASAVFLTNECLFITNFDIPASSNGSNIFFNVNGCLVIPVEPDKTNLVLKFVAVNGSAIKVNDLEFSVTLPREWGCLADPKWHNGNFFIKSTPSSLEHLNIKELQTWCISVPWAVFPENDVTFPTITNTCFIINREEGTKMGFMAIEARSTDFTNFIIAHTLFFPRSSNFFKPFVTIEHSDSNGLLQLSASLNELVESQKQ